jgi:hypothetical protein
MANLGSFSLVTLFAAGSSRYCSRSAEPTASESSAPEGQRVMSVKTTKKSGGRSGGSRAARVADDDTLPEYDFSSARRNPYASRFPKGIVVVTLDPDVARVFPDAQSVNDALRALARIVVRRPGGRGRKASKARRRG